jgi:hypothetical protein
VRHRSEDAGSVDKLVSVSATCEPSTVSCRCQPNGALSLQSATESKSESKSGTPQPHTPGACLAGSSGQQSTVSEGVHPRELPFSIARAPPLPAAARGAEPPPPPAAGRPDSPAPALLRPAALRLAPLPAAPVLMRPPPPPKPTRPALSLPAAASVLAALVVLATAAPPLSAATSGTLASRSKSASSYALQATSHVSATAARP